MRHTSISFLIDAGLFALVFFVALTLHVDSKAAATGIRLAVLFAGVSLLSHRLDAARLKDIAGVFRKAVRGGGSAALPRIPGSTSGPLGRVCVGFNSMAERHDSRLAAIEKEVAERGSALERALAEKRKLEVDVRQSDRHVRAILSSLQTGVLLIDAETHVIEDVNPVAAAIIGRTREEIIGRKCHQFVCPACEGSCPITNLRQQVDNSERVLLRSDGEQVPILKTVMPITLEGRAYLIESFADLSECQQREQVLQSQLDLSIALSFTSSLEESLAECLTIILRGLKRESGGICFARPDGTLVLSAWRGVSAKLIRSIESLNGMSLVTSLVADGPVYLPPSELPPTARAACEREGFKSTAMVPIHSSGKLAACFLVGSHRLTTMPPWLRGALETMAGHLGQTIARLEGERALRDAHTELDQILHAAAPLCVVDPSGRLLRVNRTFCSLFGLEEADVVGKNCCEVLPCKKCRQATCPVARAATSGESTTLEIEKLAGNGRVVSCMVTVSPFRDSRGGIIGIVESYHDISGIKEVEGELRKLHQAVHQASSTIVITDPEGRIEYVNPQFCRTTGYSIAEAMGRNPRLLKSGEQEGDVYRELWQAIASGREWHGELSNRRKDGSLYWEDVSISPVFDEQGRIVNYLAVKDDITDRKRTELEMKGYAEDLAGKNALLTELAAAAEKANEAKTQFLANMSHELRTPLHGILSFATFGIKKSHTATKEKLHEYFRLIAESGESLLALLDDLLDLARLESGRLGATFAPADLHNLARSIVDENQALLARRRITVDMASPDGPTTVRVDAMKIKQVVRNLLVNAIKFSPDGAEIEIAIRRNGEEMLLAIADQGMGIPEDELEAVFDKFIQSSKTRSGAGGTGLGLAICREIISMHQGRIWAETRPGGGAVLTFAIPAGQPDEHEPDDYSAVTATGGEVLTPREAVHAESLEQNATVPI